MEIFPAQAILGQLYFDGNLIERNFDRAAFLFRQSAKNGNANGQFGLASLYQKGLGVPQDFAEAKRYYEFAAAKGHENAQYNLALMFEYGEGGQKNIKKALSLYEKVAETGNAEAAYRLALRLRMNQNLGQVRNKFEKWFQIAAAGDISSAKLALAHYISNPENAAVYNLREVFKYYVQAADDDKSEAQMVVGRWLEKGKGVDKDQIGAFRFFQMAADSGVPEAQYKVGIYLMTGNVVAKNEQKAVYYFKEASAAGNLEALAELGKALYKGYGIEKDVNTAANLFLGLLMVALLKQTIIWVNYMRLGKSVLSILKKQ